MWSSPRAGAMRLSRSLARFSSRYFSSKQNVKEDLHSIICRQIRSVGPLSVAEYMRLALHHPVHGYYKNSSVVGPDGDFITSPEISQMFGEIIGVWVVSEWMKYGKNTSFDIVEFGPGRGTLMANVLKALCHFPAGSSLFRHLRFIERSDHLREMQESAILPILKTHNLQPKVTWHSTLDEIPSETTTFYIANEFFDALPIHRFQKIEDKWCEVFVNAVNPANPSEPGDELVFATAQSNTLACEAYLPLLGDISSRKCLEICPEAGGILQKVAARIEANGGSALVIDYGHVGDRENTLRAFKNHELHDPLKDPGLADITADVDFGFLRTSVETTGKNVIVHGPVTQAYFLVHMGILLRLKKLVESAKTEEVKKSLIAATEMLIGSNQMGKRFKFMALTAGRSEKEKSHVPAGFYPTWEETDQASNRPAN